MHSEGPFAPPAAAVGGLMRLQIGKDKAIRRLSHWPSFPGPEEEEEGRQDGESLLNPGD